jgi:hypothetical protein
LIGVNPHQRGIDCDNQDFKQVTRHLARLPWVYGQYKDIRKTQPPPVSTANSKNTES